MPTTLDDLPPLPTADQLPDLPPLPTADQLPDVPGPRYTGLPNGWKYGKPDEVAQNLLPTHPDPEGLKRDIAAYRAGDPRAQAYLEALTKTKDPGKWAPSFGDPNPESGIVAGARVAGAHVNSQAAQLAKDAYYPGMPDMSGMPAPDYADLGIGQPKPGEQAQPASPLLDPQAYEAQARERAANLIGPSAFQAPIVAAAGGMAQYANPVTALEGSFADSRLAGKSLGTSALDAALMAALPGGVEAGAAKMGGSPLAHVAANTAAGAALPQVQGATANLDAMLSDDPTVQANMHAQMAEALPQTGPSSAIMGGLAALLHAPGVISRLGGAPKPVDPNALTQTGLEPVVMRDSQGNEPLPWKGPQLPQTAEAAIAANGGSPGAQLGRLPDGYEETQLPEPAPFVPRPTGPADTQFAPVRPGDSFDVGATTDRGVAIPDPADVAIGRGLGPRLSGGSAAELTGPGVKPIGGRDIPILMRPEPEPSQGLGAKLKIPGRPDLPLETPGRFHPDDLPTKPWPALQEESVAAPREAPLAPADAVPTKPWPKMAPDADGLPPLPSAKELPDLPEVPERPKAEAPARAPEPVSQDVSSATSAKPEAGTEPPRAPGTVRMYHGGAEGDGPRWFINNRPYAEGYARKSNSPVWYVDVPRDHPIFDSDYPDQTVDQGMTVSTELPAELANRKQRLPDYSPEPAAKETPLSPKAQGLVDSLTPEERTALGPSIEHLKANPDPAGDFGNLKMLLDMNRAKAQKVQAGGFVTKAQAAERKAAPAVDPNAETRVMESSNAQSPAPRKDVSSPRQGAPTERSLRPVEPEAPRDRNGAGDGRSAGERAAPEARPEADVPRAEPDAERAEPGAPGVPEEAPAANRAHSPGDRVVFDTPSLKGVRGKVVADTGKPNVRVESDLGETMSVPRKNVRAAEGDEAFRKRYLGGNQARSGQAINPIEGAAELVERAAKTIGSMVKGKPEQAARDRALDVLKKTDRTRQAESFNALQKAKEWKKELTGPELEDVTRAIEKTLPKGKTLTEAQVRVKNQVSAAYEAMRKTINDFVLKGTGEGEYLRQLENYVAHFYKNGDTAGVRGQVANWVKNSPSAKKRLLPTFEEAKKIGLEPLTENSADLFAKYAEVNWKSAANRVFIDQIKKIDLANGTKAAMPAADAPSDWPRLPMPAGDNYAFHPDIFPAVRNMMDNPFGGNFVKGVENLLAMTKSLALEGSLFHHLTLTQGGMAAGYTLRNPLRGLATVGENGKPLQFSAARGQELLKDPEFVRDAVGHGLSLKAPIDVGGEHNVQVMAKWADKAPDLVKRYAKGIAERYKQWHDMLWSLRDGLKAHSYESMVGRALEHAPDDITPEAIDAIKEKMADAANNFFGGQQWKEKLWLSPKMRQMANWFMLAPDWTLSSAKLATEPLTAAAKLDKTNLAVYGRYLFGMGMVLTASTVALHSAIYQAFGDPEKGDHPFPWQNESGQGTQVDVTPLYREIDKMLGKPETQQRQYASFGKQERELVRWVEDPQHELINKMSPLARQGMEQVFNASGDPNFPVPWKGEGFWDSIPARAKEAAKVLLPYGVQGGSFALTLPQRKGMTPFKAQEATAAAFTKYATGTGEEQDLHDLVADVLQATEQNGHDPDKAFHDGLAKARSPFYGAYLKAMDAQDEKGMEAAATAIERLEGSVAQVKASAKARGLELTDTSALDDAGVKSKPPARHHAHK